MVTYWVKTPQWLKKLFPAGVVWDMPAGDVPVVYITFDDGPHPTITNFVLQQLAAHSAKATFFCVGNNVALYPEVYQRTIAAGHTTGNHTYHHINGWKTDNETYLKSIAETAQLVAPRIFRPPYGRIKLSQIRKLKEQNAGWKIYMWDVLSGDFDRNITPEQCLKNVLDNITPGSIIVFHDSEKAWERMSYALPKVLEYCNAKGWRIEPLPG